ncbi:Nitrile hydratase subunit beta [bacterium HR24]|nr:Nitrile hydratase subunit beta [bacterium HR24]
MNGVHDLGGMHGLGRVPVDPHEPVFHAEWERLTFALVFGALGQRLFNIDEFRFARERMPPVHSLAARYYERMLYALELLLAEKGVLATEAVETRHDPFWNRRTPTCRTGVTRSWPSGCCGPSRRVSPPAVPWKSGRGSRWATVSGRETYIPLATRAWPDTCVASAALLHACTALTCSRTAMP